MKFNTTRATPALVMANAMVTMAMMARGKPLGQPVLYLEPYKIPHRFHFRSSLPKSPVGKISRHALRADGAALPNIT